MTGFGLIDFRLIRQKLKLYYILKGGDDQIKTWIFIWMVKYWKGWKPLNCSVFIDSTWEYNIHHSRKQIIQGTFVINTSKHILSEKHLKILYYSLVYPYLHYGILLCGNALIKHIRGIQIAPNKCVRAIFGAKCNAPYLPIFKQLGLLKFLDIYELYTCLFMYNFLNGGLPSHLLGIYQYHRDIHDHNTRHITDPRTPSANSDILRKSFLYQGPKL